MVAFTVFLKFHLYISFIDFTLNMATGNCQPKCQFGINKNIFDLGFYYLGYQTTFKLNLQEKFIPNQHEQNGAKTKSVKPKPLRS